MADAQFAHSGAVVVRPLRFAPPQTLLASTGVLGALVGGSAAMQSVFAAMARLAPHARATLVSGETGTGKSTVARALHQLGPQRSGAFQTAAGPEAWIHADPSSTVFLPDVGDLPIGAQAGLARALGECADAPAGVGLHVVAATARDLQSDIAAGRFRADLYYRLAVFELHLPPLRERRDDIPALAALFLRNACARLRLPHKQLTSGAVKLLQNLPWMGNLRELQNVIERASVLWDGDVLAEPAVRTALALGPLPVQPASGPTVDAAESSTRLDDAQRQHVRAVLAAAKGNKTHAAAHLGVSRRALYRLIDRLERRVPLPAGARASD